MVALVLRDLRMGAETDYTLPLRRGGTEGDAWREIPPRAAAMAMAGPRRLGEMWHRIWNAPAETKAMSHGATMKRPSVRDGGGPYGAETLIEPPGPT